ncbi:MAG: carbon-nitrogen hydrolase family protein, partial [Bacillota bacterium]
MRVACIQLEACDLERAEEGLSHALSMVEKALAIRPDVIVLPECTYPAYFLPGYDPARLRPPEEVLDMFAGMARRGQCYLAVGVVEPGLGGRLLNSAVLLSPTGRVVARGHKHLLWHFDRRWFTPGSAPALASTPWGKMGMFVCADGRLPEIPRLLALAGARLQLDLTAWVSSGRDPDRLTNPQAEYMLRVRALENRCYMAAANKVGMEAGRVVYCGRSQVVSPDGHVLALAGSASAQVIHADIELPGVTDPLWPDFDPLRDRQPSAYAVLASPALP